MPMKGAKEHLARLKRLSGAEVRALAGSIVYEGADMIRAESYRGISAGSVSGKNHVVSAPGEYPNRESGELQSGLEIEQTGPTSAEFRSTAPHARPLEFGTSKMAARPHVRPARDKMAPKIRKRFAEQFAKLVNRSG